MMRKGPSTWWGRAFRLRCCHNVRGVAEPAQVRSFGKEGAACERYRGAVVRTQSWGLKSAAAGGLFTTFNGTVAPGGHGSRMRRMVCVSVARRLFS